MCVWEEAEIKEVRSAVWDHWSQGGERGLVKGRERVCREAVEETDDRRWSLTHHQLQTCPISKAPGKWKAARISRSCSKLWVRMIYSFLFLWRSECVLVSEVLNQCCRWVPHLDYRHKRVVKVIFLYVCRVHMKNKTESDVFHLLFNNPMALNVVFWEDLTAFLFLIL